MILLFPRQLICFLIQLSGIGPAEHLEELGIPIVTDLPVGQHLMDHVSV